MLFRFEIRLLQSRLWPENEATFRTFCPFPVKIMGGMDEMFSCDTYGH